MARFKRILLKLSGESLMGKQGYGIDPERLSDYAAQITEVSEMGVQIGIVIGGGNIFRGLSGSQKGFDRVKGDQMGMCATVINSLALSSALGAVGVKNKVLTAIRMEPIGEFYTKWKAIEAMEAGYVCIFSAGTGSPYFTTDTGSSLRGIEIEADVMLKGTRVDGIYTADPEKDPTATKFEDITYKEVLERGLKVMDLLNLFELDVFAVGVVEDFALLLLIATVNNRHTTARSCSAGSVFLFLIGLLLLPLEIVIAKGVLVAHSLFTTLLVLSLCTALAPSALAAFKVFSVKGILLLLFLDLLVAVVVVFYLFPDFLHAFIHEVDDYHNNDSDGNEAEDDGGKNEFNHIN